jgi:asparagine synthase (glutamine-hydrolysing)
MLDTELLSTAAAIPGQEKVRRKGTGFQTKAPLRRAMRGRLPDRLLDRPKRGMPTPMNDWLRGPGAHFLQDRVARVCERCSDLFLPETIHELVRSQLSGEGDHAIQLWTLVMFDAWRASLGAD